MLRLKGGLDVVDIGDGFDVMRAGQRTPLVSFYTPTGNVYVMHGSGDGKQILSSVPVDEWQQRAHEWLIAQGSDSPWEVCELRLQEGFIERPSESLGLLIFKRGRESTYQLYVFLDHESGDVVSFRDGGSLRRVFRTIEEAHEWLIEQDAESPWEWAPTSAMLDQTQTQSSEAYQKQWENPDPMDELRKYLNDHMNGNVRPHVGPAPDPHRLNEATAALLESCTDGTGRVFEMSKFGTIDALKKRIAELESERDSWKRAAEYASEKIDKARSIFS